MASKRYTVHVPREYTKNDGTKGTDFLRVGAAFPLKERDGFSVELYFRVLPSDRLVLFVYEPKPGTESPSEERGDDDIPF